MKTTSAIVEPFPCVAFCCQKPRECQRCVCRRRIIGVGLGDPTSLSDVRCHGVPWKGRLYPGACNSYSCGTGQWAQNTVSSTRASLLIPIVGHLHQPPEGHTGSRRSEGGAHNSRLPSESACPRW